MTFEEAIHAMFKEFMLRPELPSGKRNERISTTVKGTDVRLQVLEDVYPGFDEIMYVKGGPMSLLPINPIFNLCLSLSADETIKRKAVSNRIRCWWHA